MKKHLLPALLLTIVLCGCQAVPSLEDGTLAVTIPEEFIQNNSTDISSWNLRGNGKLFKSDAENDVYYWAAEGAWEKGYKYFIVDNLETRFDDNEYLGPYYQSKATVYMFNEFTDFTDKFDGYFITEQVFTSEDAKSVNMDRQAEANDKLKEKSSSMSETSLYIILGILGIAACFIPLGFL